jgi:enoyl-[acyl-carrier protein] reductase I
MRLSAGVAASVASPNPTTNAVLPTEMTGRVLYRVSVVCASAVDPARQNTRSSDHILEVGNQFLSGYFQPSPPTQILSRLPLAPIRRLGHIPIMLNIDLTGRRALVAGVADDGGFGFAIAKALAEAGASVSVATWPPALNIFMNLLERGKMDESRKMSNGELLQFERIYPLDAAYDTLADAPEDIRTNKRYKDTGDFSIEGLANRVREDFGDKGLDIVIHSLANGPEVKKPLLETSRNGYLTAVGVSAYSLVGMINRLGPMMRDGGSFLSLTYMASERVIPGYGGGMSSAKAALESDTRTLAYEAGRKYGIRVNTISAGPYASRAASAIGIIDRMVTYCAANSPLSDPLTAEEVGTAAAFLVSPLGSGITGTIVYVDKGYHSMGMAVTALDEANPSPS